jgi:hypothetical protein
MDAHSQPHQVLEPPLADEEPLQKAGEHPGMEMIHRPKGCGKILQ